MQGKQIILSFCCDLIKVFMFECDYIRHMIFLSISVVQIVNESVDS